MSSLLVGRGAERAVLTAALGDVERGAGGAVALTGAAGLGKSRLARDLLATSRAAGLPVLVGRATQGSAAVPYRAIRETLQSWERDHPLPPADELGGYARAIAQLLEGRLDEAGQPVSPVFLAEGYVRVLRHVARPRGVVVLLEDLHWADEETLAVVEYLADHAAESGLLAVLTCRGDEPGSARPLLDALSARGSATPMRLVPLDRDEVGEMAADALGGPVAPALVDLLHDRSEGVPLLVEELAAALRQSGGLVRGPDGHEADAATARLLPSSVTETVRARLDPLTEQERLVLAAAATLGRSFDWSRLGPVSGCDETAVIETLRDATEANLLEEDPSQPGTLRFRHALIRDAVLAATFPPRRAALARAALDVVVSDTPEDAVPDQDLALAVDLATAAGDTPLAARLALQAAWRAFDRWALPTSQRWLSRARRLAGGDTDLVVKVDLLHLRVETMVGRLDVARSIGRALLARLPQTEAALRVETHLRLGQVAADHGAWQESLDHLAAVEPHLHTLGDECAVTRFEVWSAVASISAGDVAAAERHGRRAIELAEPYDDQMDLTCCTLMHLGRTRLPDVGAARSLWLRGLELATDHGLRLWRGRLQAELGGAEVGRLGGDVELAEALAIAHETGATELAHRVELSLAELALLRGAVTEAGGHLAAAERQADGAGVAPATRHRGDVLRGLVAALAGHAPPSGGNGGGPGHASPLVRAVAALAADDLEAARSAFSAEQSADPTGSPTAPRNAHGTGPEAPYAAVLTLLGGVEKLAGLGDPDAAPADPGVSVVTPAAAVAMPPGVLGDGLRRAAAAAAAAHAGHPDDAAAELAEAARLLDGAPWLRASAVRLVAPAVVEGDGGEQVRSLLRDAATTFESLGLERPADGCRALLRDTGVAVPRRVSAQAGVPERLRAFGVTARELEVLRLVAEGLTSRDIADRLYLSPRTVEKHVERLLTKTGSANRTALAALLGPAT